MGALVPETTQPLAPELEERARHGPARPVAACAASAPL